MGDEATDVCNRTELPVCMASVGLPLECFIELINVPDTTAETITTL